MNKFEETESPVAREGELLDLIAEKETKNQENQEKKTVSKRAYIMRELLLYAIMIVLCVFIIPRYVIQRTVVDGSSMENTLQNHDNLLVEKVSYRFKTPERFDIVVFYPFHSKDSEFYVKRIIGLPGETVQIKGSDIYINGEILEENYGKDPIVDPGIAKDPIVLGEDEYFVLGDNRTVSKDSREIGVIYREDIVGKAIFRIWPLTEFGKIEE